MAGESQFNWVEDTWKFVRAYVGQRDHLAHHQINSYNRFVQDKVAQIVARANPIRLHFDYDPDLNAYRHRLLITLEEPGFGVPTVRTASGCRVPITPHHARSHKNTYAADLIVDVRVQTTVVTSRRHADDASDEVPPPRIETSETFVSGYRLGSIPVMINSCLCATRGKSPEETHECVKDPGGYFIVNGTEKVLVSTERPAENNIMVYPNAQPPSADVKSIPSAHCVRPRGCQVKFIRGPFGDDVVRVFIPQVRQNIPLWTVMIALGGRSDRNIMQTLLANLAPRHVRVQAEQILRSSVRESQVRTQDEAVEFIARHVSSFGGDGQAMTRLTGAVHAAHARARAAAAAGDVDSEERRRLEDDKARIDLRKRISYARLILQRDILPHVGKNPRKKRLFLAKMFRELAYGKFTRADDDDRDSFVNKRINAAGALMTQLFSQAYTRLVRDVKTSVNKTYSKGAWRASGDFHSILHGDNLYRHIRPSILTKTVRMALSTGNMGAKGTTNLVGVSQVLGRLSYNATLSHIRRVLAPLGNNSGKLLKPRALHATHIFAMCPSETPEGQPVGLVKNLALSARVSEYCSPEPTRALLRRLGVEEIGRDDDDDDAATEEGAGDENAKNNNSTDDAAAEGARENDAADPPSLHTRPDYASLAHVYVDGDWWGLTNDPAGLLSELRAARLRGEVHPHTSILWDRTTRARSTGSPLGEIRLCGTGGRILRPLFRLRPDGSFVATEAHTRFLREGGTFETLIQSGLMERYPGLAHLEVPIEYADVAETDTLMIAMTAATARKARPGVAIRFTHCELHPALMFGVLAGVIPFSDHNQSPRNTYQSAMGKQAVGIPTTNFRECYPTLGHLLHYPQTPFVQSRIQTYLPMLQSGQHLVVAIAVNGGYNQEDSLILNQGSVDLGLLTSTMFKTYRSQEHTTEGTSHSDIFCNPMDGAPDGAEIVGTKIGAYDKLGPDGLARVGSVVKNGDVIIGKITPLSAKGSRCRTIATYRDSSVVVRNCTGGVIDRATIHEAEDGSRIARVVVQSLREASVGDKFSSRHGQKGTCGVLRRHSEMPFTASGVVPDAIMNPHAIPSRMTVGQLVEMFLTKICALTGTVGDATPFTGMRPETILAFAEASGAAARSDEVLYDPTTGRRQKCVIFMCPTYYQKLRHIARDKSHARSTGPMIELTRQPTEGRIRDGGLRLGEMERDCVLGHGMSAFTRESYLKRSDDYYVGVCDRCGTFAPHNAERGIRVCHACTRLLRTEGNDEGGGSWTDVSRVEIPYATKLFMQELSAMQIDVSTRTSASSRP